MHVTAVLVLDPAGAPVPYTFAAVRETVDRRLGRAPLFTRRLVEVPFGLAHPIWIDGGPVDLDYHVRRACLPEPGGRAELEELVGRLAGRPLDRRRPLWEMTVVEGLEAGRVAVVAKVHHSAIDGVSAAELAAAWLDTVAEPTEDPADSAPRKSGPAADSGVGTTGDGTREGGMPEAGAPSAFGPHVGGAPSRAELIAGALAELAATPFKATLAANRIAKAVLGKAERARSDRDGGVQRPISAPELTINRSIGPDRRVAFGSVPLEEIRAVGRHFGCTVNDALLAVCAGAMRSLLERTGELPAEPLVAFVPISVRAGDDRGSGANELSAMLVPLATDLEDPAERIRAIASGTRRAKADAPLVSAELLADCADVTFPGLVSLVARLVSSTRLFDKMRPVFNVTISNVPGPPFPLFLAGSRVINMFPLGPISDGAALNITVVSYCAIVYFGFTGCRDSMPHVGELPDLVRRSLDELLAISRSRRLPSSAEPDVEPDVEASSKIARSTEKGERDGSSSGGVTRRRTRKPENAPGSRDRDVADLAAGAG